MLLWRGLLAGGVMSAWLAWRRGRAGLADWKRWAGGMVGSKRQQCGDHLLHRRVQEHRRRQRGHHLCHRAFAAAAIAWVWMRETPGLATLAAAGLCLAGVTLMVGGSAGSRI